MNPSGIRPAESEWMNLVLCRAAAGLGHGQAARQSLESCVSCHAERDCLACHSATRGRRINPHGPDFNAERLRESAPSMCVACHGTSVPKG